MAHTEPLGDQALIIELGNEVDPAVNAAVCALAARIEAARIPGVVDVVPAFASVGVHFHADALPTLAGASPFEALVARLRPLLEAGAASVEDPLRTIEIPVCYGGEHGVDLVETAALCGLTPEALVRLHVAADLRVYMLGFAPGAPYIGLLDPRLGVPRLAKPRTNVAAGSIGIANRQSVVYPTAAPGGWRLIGRTPLVLFDIAREPACLLRPGDRIRFVAIDADEFARRERADAEARR